MNTTNLDSTKVSVDPGVISSFVSFIITFVSRPGVRKVLATVVAALIPAGEIGIAANEPTLLNDDQAERQIADSALWIAQITDPHLFEEFKNSDLTANEVEDRQAFAKALRFLGTGQATEGRVPDALVITGDFGVDPSFLQKRRRISPLTREQQVDTLVALLRGSTVKNVYVVIGNNDLANEAADPNAFAYFHAIVDSASQRLRSSGVRLRNLTACYPSGPPASCTADLRGGVRLVGFASASFKNQPSGPSGSHAKYDRDLRTARADSSQAWDSATVDMFAQLVSTSRAAGRTAIVLTHEPDITDPYARSVIDTVSDVQRRVRLDPAVWNVTPAVRTRFETAVTGGSVLAVIAGHLHSSSMADYVREYEAISPRGIPSRVPVFVSPPLAIKNQDRASSQARGISFYRIANGDIRRDIVWLNRGTFNVAQAQLGTVPSTRSSRTPSASSTGIGTPARIGIAVFAIVVATLSVMGGFKVGMRELLDRRGARAEFRWLENFWFEPVIAGPFAGLVLVIILFGSTWHDRAEVAMWYGADLLLAAFAAGFVIQLVRKEIQSDKE